MQVSRINLSYGGDYGFGEIAVTMSDGNCEAGFYEFRIASVGEWPGFNQVCDKPLLKMTAEELADVIAFCVKTACAHAAG